MSLFDPNEVLFADPPSGPFLSGTFHTPPANRRLPRLRVYVDETGDRNFGPSRQSDWFTMTAVILPEEQHEDLRFVAGGLRRVIGMPEDAMLHWVQHFKARRAHRRTTAAAWLARIPNLQLVHAVLHKPSVATDAHMRSAPDRAYSYTAKLLLERVANVAREWPTGPRLAQVRLGVVGGVDHAHTHRYLNHVAVHPRFGERAIPWGHLRWPLTWSQSADFDGLQIADIYAGMLHAAIHQPNGASPLLSCAHQHRRSPYAARRVLGYGVKVYPDAGLMEWHRMLWTSGLR